MRGRGFIVGAALLIGCDVDRGGLAAGTDPTDTAVVVVVDAEVEATAEADAGIDTEMAAETPDDALPTTCADGGAPCDDKDPCTSNVCDEDVGTCSFPLYQDGDGDGLQPSGAAPGCAKDYDCDDGNAEAFPGQTKYFSVHSDLAEFDYNCDGVTEARWSSIGSCTKGMGGCELKVGWKDTVPACGVSGEWISECGSSCAAETTVARVQECR